MARAFDDQAALPAGDVLTEKCGVVAVYAPGTDVARLVYFGLYALQHRGQESAGIAVGDGTSITSHREMGLLSGVFNEDILGRLTGERAIGHTRYSTSGSSIMVNAQPFVSHRHRAVRLRAQRHLTNADALDALPRPSRRCLGQRFSPKRLFRAGRRSSPASKRRWRLPKVLHR